MLEHNGSTSQMSNDKWGGVGSENVLAMMISVLRLGRMKPPNTRKNDREENE